jgi:hypothetical protein
LVYDWTIFIKLYESGTIHQVEKIFNLNEGEEAFAHEMPDAFLQGRPTLCAHRRHVLLQLLRWIPELPRFLGNWDKCEVMGMGGCFKQQNKTLQQLGLV